MVFNNRILIWSTCFVLLACNEPVNQKADERIEQLMLFAHTQSIDLSKFDYILIEGRIKCKGCAEEWTQRISSGIFGQSSVLVVGGDSTVFTDFDMAHGDYRVVAFDSIERAFPYIANYFLFYKKDGIFEGQLELGARNISIPEATR